MFKHTIDTSLPKNLPLMLRKNKSENLELILQQSKDKSGIFIKYTYQQVYTDIIALAYSLRKLGLKKNSNVALISDNRKEWLVTDMAILSLGCADVPRGCDSMGNEIRFIISFSDSEFGFFENNRQLKKVLENITEVPKLKYVILFDPPTQEEEELAVKAGLKVFTFENLLSEGLQAIKDNPEIVNEIEQTMESIEEDDTATIIFTSGTTGTPKGVMLTHKNYMAQMGVIHNFVYCKPGDTWMTILPVWHSFERLIQYVAIKFKCSLAYSKPVAPILLKDFDAVKPEWICGVPRLWESLANGINKAMKKTGGSTYKAFNFFMNIGKAYVWAKNRVTGNIAQFKKRSRVLDFIVGIIPFILLWPLHKLGDKLVYSKIRAKFGGRIHIAISGGGALQSDVDNFYRAIGFNLLEGYGLTETAPVISFRNHRKPRPGVVGVIFPTFEVRIVKEEHGVITSMEPLKPGKKGMIVVRGSQIMKGYYKRPDLTDKIIDKEGWLNTGDLGLMTYDGELKITGRAKDTIVLLGGENIEPAVIESSLVTNEYIESAIVLGQDQKYLASLIVPAKDSVIAFAQEKGLDTSDYGLLLKTKEVISLFENAINSIVSTENDFRTCEKIFKFALLENSFTVGEELSAKQEMMRYKIVEKYDSVIKTLF